MAAIPYPSIDTGFIYDPGKKLDALISDFMEAEQAQSYIFRGEISSLPYILQQYPNDLTNVIIEIRNQLRIYLGKYFDDLDVEVAEHETNSTTTTGIRVYIKAWQADQTVTLNQRLKVSGTKLIESLKIRE